MWQLIGRATLVWVGLFVLAFINGGLREIVFRKFIESDKVAHQISCLTGVLLWTSFVVLVWNRLRILTLNEAVWVGGYWFVLTMLVETFVLNRKLTWEQIGETYNVAHGELWGLVLIWIGLMPVILFKFKIG